MPVYLHIGGTIVIIHNYTYTCCLSGVIVQCLRPTVKQYRWLRGSTTPLVQIQAVVNLCCVILSYHKPSASVPWWLLQGFSSAQDRYIASGVEVRSCRKIDVGTVAEKLIPIAMENKQGEFTLRLTAFPTSLRMVKFRFINLWN